MNRYRFFSLCLGLMCGLHLSAKDYYATDFGVKADGKTLNTSSIQKGIDFVNAQGGGRLVFTAGNYQTGTIYLKSNVTLHLEEGATLLGSTNPWDYEKDPYIRWMSMIFAVKQQNIGITGKGTINGRGFQTANNMVDYIQRGIYEDPLKLGRPNETNRPQNIYFRECENVTIKDITLRDPASWNQTYDQCKNLYVDGIHVDSKSYWNNDGIDVVDCDGVVLKNSFIDAADDALCFKSHDANSMCQNVVVENCVGRSSASGLKFGTVSRGGFRNFKVKNIKIYDTYRSAITFAAVDGALIENIEVDGVRSIHTGNVIYLRIGDRWSAGKKPIMKNITIKNVYAEIPMDKPDAGYNYEGPIEDLPRNISPASIVGLPEYKIQNVTLQNIEIVSPGGGNPYYAYRGLAPAELDSIPEMATSYPEFSQFKELPAWGFYIRHAEGITFDNVTFKALKKDYQVAMFGIKSDGVTLNTRSIQRAVDYISEQGGGRLIFYVGRYLTGSIELKSNVTIRIEEGAVLVAVPSVYDFKGVGGCNAIIYADKQKNIGIGGKGIIDGRSIAVRASVEEQLQKGHIEGNVSDYAPALICMEGCEDVKIEQVTLQDAANIAEIYKDCHNVTVDKVVVNAGASDRKAISISGCDGVKMTDCYFNMAGNPLESAGTSRNLIFTNCITPDGKAVSSDQ